MQLNNNKNVQETPNLFLLSDLFIFFLNHTWRIAFDAHIFQFQFTFRNGKVLLVHTQNDKKKTNRKKAIIIIESTQKAKSNEKKNRSQVDTLKNITLIRNNDIHCSFLMHVNGGSLIAASSMWCTRIL